MFLCHYEVILMMALLKTAERTNNLSQVNNYVFQRHMFAYKEAIKYLGNLAIELGCGDGYGIKLLAQHCHWYAGIDKYDAGWATLNPRSAFFKSHLPRLNNIGDNCFDTVICFQVIEHIKEDKSLISEIHRILKPGGTLLLTTPNKLMSLTRNPYHIREYTPCNIQQLIAANFSQFEIWGIYGNEKVMKYYMDNKRSVERILSFDILKLQEVLPAHLLKLPYNLLNNLNRKLLFKQDQSKCAEINWDDFFLDELSDECLDYFVVARKE